LRQDPRGVAESPGRSQHLRKQGFTKDVRACRRMGPQDVEPMLGFEMQPFERGLHD
jgi:hypothetical protein